MADRPRRRLSLLLSVRSVKLVPLVGDYANDG